MNISGQRALAVAFAVLFASPISRAAAGPDEVTRFGKEYPAAVARLESRFAQVKGTCRLTRQFGDKPARSTKGTFAVDHGYGKISFPVKLPRSKSEMEAVYCSGANTGFRLRRMSAGSGYIIDGVGESARVAYSETIGILLGAPYAILGKPMSRVMESPGFQLVDAREVEFGKKRCVRVEIRYEAGDGKGPAKDTAAVTLDPDAGWAILRTEFRPAHDPGLLMTFDVEYAPPQGGMPVPRSVKVTTPGSSTSCEFETVSFEPTPEREFAMNYYGLPDLTKPRGEPWWKGTAFWLVGAAALGLVVAYALRRLASSPSGTSPQAA